MQLVVEIQLSRFSSRPTDCISNLRFLVYLQNARQFSPKDIPSIRSILNDISDKFEPEVCTFKNIRVSDEEVQLDIFVWQNDSQENQEEIARNVAEQFESNIGSLRKIINLSKGLTIGLDEYSIIQRVVQSFNSKRFWESQETAEAIWNKTIDCDERDVVQGVILTGAALVHHQRNEDEVCLSILGRALKKLQAFDRVSKNRRAFLLIDIESLRKAIQTIVSSGEVRVFEIMYTES